MNRLSILCVAALLGCAPDEPGPQTIVQEVLTTNQINGSGLLTANPCPAGYEGVTIGVDNHNVQACEDIVP